jgi:hypothetical protein
MPYSWDMNGASLPARIAYAAIALPLGGGAGFYSCMRLLPGLTGMYPQVDPGGDGFGIFKLAICAGVAVAFTASLFVLTLPWVRHRKRRGRGVRIAFTCVLVVLASIAFADQGYGLMSDLAIAAWLTYTMAFTFVRYGVLDRARRSSASLNDC